MGNPQHDSDRLLVFGYCLHRALWWFAIEAFCGLCLFLLFYAVTCGFVR